VRAALLLILLAALLAACGGDTLALDPVAQAADTTAKAGSEHVEFLGTSTVQGQKIQLSGSGDFRNDPQLGQMTVRYTAGSQTGEMTQVIKGWRIYMTSPLFARLLPQGKTWMSLDLQKASKAAGIDFRSMTAQTPGQTLQQLKASGDVRKIGSETVAGVETTHYTATLDPAKIPSGARLQKLAGATYQPVDVWIDGDDHVRRLHMAYSTSGAAAAGVGSSSELTMTFSDYGKDVQVTVPSDAETFDATGEAAKSLQSGGS
jgi:LppX_LprAFG lipoprotein